MKAKHADAAVEIFSTCPASSTTDRGGYARAVAEVAQWSERYGYKGILVYTDNRFPEDRTGQITHQLAMKTSDSVWHKQLSELAGESEHHPYWLVPFQNYKTFCPYLVGSYTRVVDELARYIIAGYHTFILDIPPEEGELHHTNIAFSRAREQMAS